jgi:hypothetical protein
MLLSTAQSAPPPGVCASYAHEELRLGGGGGWTQVSVLLLPSVSMAVLFRPVSVLHRSVSQVALPPCIACVPCTTSSLGTV